MKRKQTHKKESFFGTRKMSLTLIAILETLLMFTFLDYLVRSLNIAYTIPPSYFGSEAIYGTIFGFFVYLFVKDKKLMQKSLAFSAIMALGIQFIFLLIGYSVNYVLTFIVFNFVIMFAVSYFWFKIKKM